MLNYRLLLVAGGFGVCLTATPCQGNAQTVVYYTYQTNSTNMSACRGFASIHQASWSRVDKKKDSLNVSYPVAAEVDPQSPAGASGLANGDSIVTINRFTTLGARDPELSLWNLDVGDFNQMQVKRAGQTLDLSFHMGVWVDGKSPNPMSGAPVPRVCRAGK